MGIKPSKSKKKVREEKGTKDAARRRKSSSRRRQSERREAALSRSPRSRRDVRRKGSSRRGGVRSRRVPEAEMKTDRNNNENNKNKKNKKKGITATNESQKKRNIVRLRVSPSGRVQSETAISDHSGISRTDDVGSHDDQRPNFQDAHDFTNAGPPLVTEAFPRDDADFETGTGARRNFPFGVTDYVDRRIGAKLEEPKVKTDDNGKISAEEIIRFLDWIDANGDESDEEPGRKQLKPQEPAVMCSLLNEDTATHFSGTKASINDYENNPTEGEEYDVLSPKASLKEKNESRSTCNDQGNGFNDGRGFGGNHDKNTSWFSFGGSDKDPVSESPRQKNRNRPDMTKVGTDAILQMDKDILTKISNNRYYWIYPNQMRSLPSYKLAGYVHQ